MDTNNKRGITINDDAWAVALSVSISGVETSTEEEPEVRTGDTIEVRKHVETRIEHKEQYEAAKKLRNRLRACVTRHTHHVDPLGNLCDTKRVEAFRADIAAVEVAVDTHNALPDQPHVVSFSVITLPIGRVFDETTQAKLVAVVRTELLRLKALLDARDVDQLGKFLNVRKNISALMPAIVARTVDSALASARIALNTLRDIRDNKLPPETFIDVGDVDTALVWVDAEQTA